MTQEQIKAKLEDFEGKLEQQGTYRDRVREQLRQAEAGVHQLQGACAVLRELLDPAVMPGEPAPLAEPLTNGVDHAAE